MSRSNVQEPVARWLVLIAPVVMVIAQIWSLVYLPPFWRQLPDPIYQYLLNGVAITTGVIPGHTDHPGTSMQWLMGLIQWLSFQIAGQGESYVADVVARPEWYLTIDASVLIVLQFIAFVYASWGLARHVGVKAVFAFQALVLAAVSVFFFTIYPGPENLVWLCTLAVIGLLAPLARTPRGSVSPRVLVALGVVLAIGATAKIIFVPVFALVVVWLRFRDAAIALGVSVVSAIAILWPVRSQIPRMWDWFTATASTSARYPDEVQTQSGLQSLLSSPLAIVDQYPLALICLLLVVLGCVAAARGDIRWADLVVRISGPGLVIIGVWVFTYKAWRSNDLMVLAPVLGLLAATLVFALFVQSGGPRWGFRSKIPGVVAAVVLIISASVFAFRIPSVIADSRERTTFDDLVDFLDERWSGGSSISYGYGVWNQATALAFANGSSGGAASAGIVERYPNWIEFNIWDSMFYRPGREGVEFVSCITLQEIARSSRGLLLAPGRDVTWGNSNPQYESLLAVPEARLGGLEVLRVFDVECGPQWYPQS